MQVSHGSTHISAVTRHDLISVKVYSRIYIMQLKSYIPAPKRKFNLNKNYVRCFYLFFYSPRTESQWGYKMQITSVICCFLLSIWLMHYAILKGIWLVRSLGKPPTIRRLLCTFLRTQGEEASMQELDLKQQRPHRLTLTDKTNKMCKCERKIGGHMAPWSVDHNRRPSGENHHVIERFCIQLRAKKMRNK